MHDHSDILKAHERRMKELARQVDKLTLQVVERAQRLCHTYTHTHTHTTYTPVQFRPCVQLQLHNVHPFSCVVSAC